MIEDKINEIILMGGNIEYILLKNNKKKSIIEFLNNILYKKLSVEIHILNHFDFLLDENVDIILFYNVYGNKYTSTYEIKTMELI